MDEATQPDAVGDDAVAPPPVEAARRSHLALGIVVSLLIAAVGIAVWAVTHAANPDREFVGISVVVGIAVAYVLHRATGSTSVGVRLIAVLITALTCVVGSTVATVAAVAHTFHAKFLTVLGDNWDDWFTVLRHRGVIHQGTFVLALVVAFFAVTPSKPKPEPAPDPLPGPAPDAEPAPDPEV